MTKIIVATIVAAFALTGCAGRSYELRPEDRTPAAMGLVKTRVDDNGNTRLEVRLRHLPPPTNLDRGLTTFVVWLRPTSDGEFRNVGQIVVNKKREGELRTTTPHGQFGVLVTAERNGDPSHPSEHVILRGYVGPR